MAPWSGRAFTIDLGAIRRNAATLSRAAAGAELWAVVKAEGYGHGAVDVSKAALEAGAGALCVATLSEALHLRAALRNARILVIGPVSEREIGEARVARLELVAADGRIPKACGSISRSTPGWGGGGSPSCPSPTRDVLGLMSHLASAESDSAFTQLQVARFRDATAGLGALTRHIANSAATFAMPRRGSMPSGAASGCTASRRSAGIPQREGLEPALRWDSYVALAKRLEPGESTGYGRRFVADRRRGSGSSRSATRTASVATCRGPMCSSRVRVGASSATSPWTRSPSCSTGSVPSARRSRWSATASTSRSMRASPTLDRVRDRDGLNTRSGSARRVAVDG